MAEGMMGALLGAGNRARRFARGMMTDPETTLADYLTSLNEDAKEHNARSRMDTETMLYNGVMRDDPSYKAARAAAEERALAEAVDMMGGGLGTIGRYVPGKFYNAGQLVGDLTKTNKTDLVSVFRNTKKDVAERQQFMRDFLSQPKPEPWKPREYAFDRSSIKDALQGHPEVSQTKFPRVQPPRADLSYIDEIYTDPINRGLIKDQIARGLPLGGETFYASLRPIYLEAQARGIPRSEVDRWIQGVAPASARNTLYNETAVGNLLYKMWKDKVPLTEANIERYKQAFSSKYGTGTGLGVLPNHAKMSARVLEEGRGMMDQLTAKYDTLGEVPSYKVPTYGMQKSGDFEHSWVGDVHEAAGETMGTRYFPYFYKKGGFTNNEYARAEPHMVGIAREMGLAGGQGQAGRWFGGGELTGLRTVRGDALDTMEKQAAYSLAAQGRKVTPQAVRDYVFETIERGGDWLPWYKRVDMPDLRFR